MHARGSWLRPSPLARIYGFLSVSAALLIVSFGPAAAGASADGSVTLPGSPLSVSVGTLGECQSSYPNVGTNYYPPFSTVGDCGFFLGFTAHAGQPTELKEKIYGFEGTAGPGVPFAEGGVEYTFLEQGPATGSGTSGDPYRDVTKYKVDDAGSKEYALITDTTTYINGEAQFASTYTVENVTGKGGSTAPPATLFFHALVAGDLFVANDDHGTGVFLGGPPKFIGGQNPNTGTLGGFIEATPAWNDYQEGYWDGPGGSPFTEDEGIWNAVRRAAKSTNPVFNDTIDPNLIDNGAGASWDDHLTSGLEPGKTASYSIINRSQVPSSLVIQPVTQTRAVGQTATVTVTATDNVGTPYAGRSLHYSIGGANPKSGSVTTNGAGVATISYVGTAAGLDTMQMFLDLAGSGVQASQDPAAAAQITWTPASPAPSSSYKVQSIKANSNGTITITFVPSQSGQATLEVTVPTATIASRSAVAAKRSKKCKKGQVKIKGKCGPATTVTGKLTANASAGVPLTLSVNPSSKIKSLLKKGKTVHLTAKLTYRSALGGTPTVQVFHVTVKGKKPKRKKGH
jgi:hypothetical protein